MSKPSKSNDKKYDMVDWWGGTVVFTFFPILISIVISICRGGSENINRVIGDGELILSAFLVTAPTIVNYANSTKRSQEHKKLLYLLLLVVFLELVAYVTIKTNPDNKPSVVYITSVLCDVSSVVISWKSELFLKREV